MTTFNVQPGCFQWPLRPEARTCTWAKTDRVKTGCSYILGQLAGMSLPFRKTSHAAKALDAIGRAHWSMRCRMAVLRASQSGLDCGKNFVQAAARSTDLIKSISGWDPCFSCRCGSPASSSIAGNACNQQKQELHLAICKGKQNREISPRMHHMSIKRSPTGSLSSGKHHFSV